MEAAAAVNADLEKEFTVASELEKPFCSKATKESEEVKQNENANLNCEDKVFPEVEGDVDLMPRPPDSNAVSSSSSEACSGDTAEDSCGILERSGDSSCVQAKKEIAKQLNEQVKVEDSDLEVAVHSGAKMDNSASTPCDSDVLNSAIPEPSQGSCVTLEQTRNFSDSKTKETAKQSAEEKSEREHECYEGEVLSKLDKDDSLAPKPCGVNLSESTCFETNCGSAFDEGSMHSDSPHGSFSTEVGKDAAGKEEENNREGHVSSSVAPRKEAEKEEGSERDGSSSIGCRKQEAGKEETQNEGHGSSSIDPRKCAAGKEEENDSEVQDSSSIEPSKKEAEKEESHHESKRDNLCPIFSHQ
ncbi:uncharacterized protein LOC119388018 isoform X2 [Rhipicephalus sanguineus]|uniref:uncharacterized protein LOC119388018 isoform X2 n=1 Tax=Rhipicephalus sanguineus TaxID=34632 RepID=UPI0020C57D66|nr:uncharacterized protein LOC119388018 isoform X2 [Rhipicephalus sanguineus]